jgi:hypothetical protein
MFVFLRYVTLRGTCEQDVLFPEGDKERSPCDSLSAYAAKGAAERYLVVTQRTLFGAHRAWLLPPSHKPGSAAFHPQTRS